MNETVITLSCPAPPFNEKEILRYAGANVNDESLLPLLRSCVAELGDALVYKICYARISLLPRQNDFLNKLLDGGSHDLAKNLEDCESAVIFGATVGIGMDRLISRYSSISPSRALMLQAIGAERIESLCDQFCKSVEAEEKTKGLFIRPRFSAGYGDFPLEAQIDIFKLLDCPRRIGLTLNESLIMSPSKSVTAIIGLSSVCRHHAAGCNNCKKNDCQYRSEK